MAKEPRSNGAAVDLKDAAVDAAKHMGIFEQLKQNRLHVELVEFKNAGDVTEGSISLTNEGEETAGDDVEIEQDKFVGI